MDKKLSEKSLRAWNLISGLLQILLAIIILICSLAAILTLLLIFSIAIMVAGLSRIINSISDEKLGNAAVIWKFLTGILAIIVGLIVFFNTFTQPIFTIHILIFIFALALLGIGISRIIVGLLTSDFHTWYRVFLIIVGFLTIGLSVIVLISPSLGFLILILLLSISLLFNGFASLINGIVGPE